MMRSVCAWLSGIVLACGIICLVSGCGSGGTSDLEKVPEPPGGKKILDPNTDMPGYKDMRDTLKAKKK